MTKPNPVDIDQLRELLNSNNTIDVICGMLRITRTRLRLLMRIHKLPRKKYPKVLRKRDTPHVCAEPTPEEILEIEARKKEVQARWSEQETNGRFTGLKRQRWTIPSYDFNRQTMSFSEDNIQ